MRRANRGSNKGSETPAPAIATSSDRGDIKQSLEPGSEDKNSHSSHRTEAGVQRNSEWLREVGERPPDNDLLQPLFLTADAVNSIKSTTKSVYRALNSWQTRLLRIHSGEGNSPLICSLVEANVIDGRGMGILESGTSKVITYEALSYSWGHSALVCSIICNEQPFGLALELATALQYLRLSAKDRYIWCDAICINQEDLVEKSQQVKNMLRIFEKAEIVVAWLGRPCPASGRLFHALQLVSDKNHQILAHEHDQISLKVVEDISFALKTHLTSPWFVRTWIRQEVFAAKKLVIQFGPYQLDFGSFFDKIQWLRLLCNSSLTPDPSITMPPTLHVYQKDYQHRGTDRHGFEVQTTLPSYVQHWIDILRSGYLFKVTNERDRIYGTLGLLTSVSVKFFARLPADPEILATSFPIDYKKQVPEVYQDVTKFLINTSKTLEILDIFGDRRHLELSDLPSWATDWSREREEFGLFHQTTYPRDGFRDLLKQDYTDPGKLKLNGIRVAGGLIVLDAKKEVSHPRDRFMPKYRRSVTLQDIMKGPSRRSYSGLSSEILNPPYMFIFTHIEESEKTFELENLARKPENFDLDFANFLAGSNYAFGYIQDCSDDVSLGLEDLHFLVPRTASLDDIVVSLYGSRCLHLLRPMPQNSSEYKYLGPIAGIACGQEHVMKYSPKNNFGLKTITKLDGAHSSFKGETFVLV